MQSSLLTSILLIAVKGGLLYGRPSTILF